MEDGEFDDAFRSSKQAYLDTRQNIEMLMTGVTTFNQQHMTPSTPLISGPLKKENTQEATPPPTPPPCESPKEDHTRRIVSITIPSFRPMLSKSKTATKIIPTSTQNSSETPTTFSSTEIIQSIQITESQSTNIPESRSKIESPVPAAQTTTKRPFEQLKLLAKSLEPSKNFVGPSRPPTEPRKSLEALRKSLQLRRRSPIKPASTVIKQQQPKVIEVIEIDLSPPQTPELSQKVIENVEIKQSIKSETPPLPPPTQKLVDLKQSIQSKTPPLATSQHLPQEKLINTEQNFISHVKENSLNQSFPSSTTSACSTVILSSQETVITGNKTGSNLNVTGGALEVNVKVEDVFKSNNLDVDKHKINVESESAWEDESEEEDNGPKPEVRIIKKMVRYVNCKLCQITVDSVGHLIEHLDEIHNIQVNSHFTVKRCSSEDEEDERLDLERTSQLLKLREGKPREVRFTARQGITASSTNSSKVPEGDVKVEVVPQVPPPSSSRYSHNVSQYCSPKVTDKNWNRCPLCYIDFYNFDRYYDHLRQHTLNLFKVCPDCDKTFAYEFHLEVHLRPKGNQTHSCPELNCQKSYFNRNCLLFHRLRHDGLHRCTECETPFKTYEEMLLHTQTNHPPPHMPKPTFSCKHSGCAMTFNSREILKAHIKSEHVVLKASGLIKCSFCLMTFKNELYLKGHVKRMHGNKSNLTARPFACKLCKTITFTHSCYLTRHMRQFHDANWTSLARGRPHPRYNNYNKKAREIDNNDEEEQEANSSDEEEEESEPEVEVKPEDTEGESESEDNSEATDDSKASKGSADVKSDLTMCRHCFTEYSNNWNMRRHMMYSCAARPKKTKVKVKTWKGRRRGRKPKLMAKKIGVKKSVEILKEEKVYEKKDEKIILEVSEESEESESSADEEVKKKAARVIAQAELFEKIRNMQSKLTGGKKVEFICPYCKKELVAKQGLLYHVARYHTEDPVKSLSKIGYQTGSGANGLQARLKRQKQGQGNLENTTTEPKPSTSQVKDKSEDKTKPEEKTKDAKEKDNAPAPSKKRTTRSSSSALADYELPGIIRRRSTRGKEKVKKSYDENDSEELVSSDETKKDDQKSEESDERNLRRQKRADLTCYARHKFSRKRKYDKLVSASIKRRKRFGNKEDVDVEVTKPEVKVEEPKVKEPEVFQPIPMVFDINTPEGQLWLMEAFPDGEGGDNKIVEKDSVYKELEKDFFKETADDTDNPEVPELDERIAEVVTPVPSEVVEEQVSENESVPTEKPEVEKDSEAANDENETENMRFETKFQELDEGISEDPVEGINSKKVEKDPQVTNDKTDEPLINCLEEEETEFLKLDEPISEVVTPAPSEPDVVEEEEVSEAKSVSTKNQEVDEDLVGTNYETENLVGVVNSSEDETPVLDEEIPKATPSEPEEIVEENAVRVPEEFESVPIGKLKVEEYSDVTNYENTEKLFGVVNSPEEETSEVNEGIPEVVTPASSEPENSQEESESVHIEKPEDPEVTNDETENTEKQFANCSQEGSEKVEDKFANVEKEDSEANKIEICSPSLEDYYSAVEEQSELSESTCKIIQEEVKTGLPIQMKLESETDFNIAEALLLLQNVSTTAVPRNQSSLEPSLADEENTSTFVEEEFNETIAEAVIVDENVNSSIEPENSLFIIKTELDELIEPENTLVRKVNSSVEPENSLFIIKTKITAPEITLVKEVNSSMEEEVNSSIEETESSLTENEMLEEEVANTLMESEVNLSMEALEAVANSALEAEVLKLEAQLIYSSTEADNNLSVEAEANKLFIEANNLSTKAEAKNSSIELEANSTVIAEFNLSIKTEPSSNIQVHSAVSTEYQHVKLETVNSVDPLPLEIHNTSEDMVEVAQVKVEETETVTAKESTSCSEFDTKAAQGESKKPTSTSSKRRSKSATGKVTPIPVPIKEGDSGHVTRSKTKSVVTSTKKGQEEKMEPSTSKRRTRGGQSANVSPSSSSSSENMEKGADEKALIKKVISDLFKKPSMKARTKSKGKRGRPPSQNQSQSDADTSSSFEVISDEGENSEEIMTKDLKSDVTKISDGTSELVDLRRTSRKRKTTKPYDPEEPIITFSSFNHI